MADEKGNVAESGTGRQPTDEDLSIARQWFERARDLIDKKNYDYAIECYINGLERWPLAIEEGHKPLMAAALWRAGAGGKKPGRLEAMKHSTSGKDALKAMLNAEYLMAKDPKNPAYLEAVFSNAVKGGFDEVALWIGPTLLDACVADRKGSAPRLRRLYAAYAALGERLGDQGNTAAGIEAYERSVLSISHLMQVDTKDLELQRTRTEIATKLTILKGRYESATTFQESVRNSAAQKDLVDRDRLVQSDERLEELLRPAREEVAREPASASAVNKLVDLLTRREDEALEDEAVAVLEKAYASSGAYPFKVRADDIRMRQLNRKARAIRASGDRDAARAHLREQLLFEMRVYRDRVKQYPTDMKYRFEYGKRLFHGRNFDEAIPVFQEARNDPRTRAQCSLYLGRCFHEKQYFDQAADVLTEAIDALERQGDELSKEMHYWLGMAYEGAQRFAEARKVYGQILQWDYNYRDVRERMDNLRGKQ